MFFFWGVFRDKFLLYIFPKELLLECPFIFGNGIGYKKYYRNYRFIFMFTKVIKDDVIMVIVTKDQKEKFKKIAKKRILQ